MGNLKRADHGRNFDPQIKHAVSGLTKRLTQFPSSSAVAVWFGPKERATYTRSQGDATKTSVIPSQKSAVKNSTTPAWENFTAFVRGRAKRLTNNNQQHSRSKSKPEKEGVRGEPETSCFNPQKKHTMQAQCRGLTKRLAQLTSSAVAV